MSIKATSGIKQALAVITGDQAHKRLEKHKSDSAVMDHSGDVDADARGFAAANGKKWHGKKLLDEFVKHEAGLGKSNQQGIKSYIEGTFVLGENQATQRPDYKAAPEDVQKLFGE
jgi:hypothetical protein